MVPALVGCQSACREALLLDQNDVDRALSRKFVSHQTELSGGGSIHELHLEISHLFRRRKVASEPLFQSGKVPLRQPLIELQLDHGFNDRRLSVLHSIYHRPTRTCWSYHAFHLRGVKHVLQIDLTFVSLICNKGALIMAERKFVSYLRVSTDK